MLKNIVIRNSCPKTLFLDLIPPPLLLYSLKSCSEAYFLFHHFSLHFQLWFRRIQLRANAVTLITYTVYLGIVRVWLIHKKGETTPNGVEEMLGHNCFEMPLFMPTQEVSLITDFSVSHRKVTLLVYERWINGMLVRVCSVSAPVVDSLYWGAAPKLGFLQMNPGQAMETHEQGGDNLWRDDDKCTKNQMQSAKMDKPLHSPEDQRVSWGSPATCSLQRWHAGFTLTTFLFWVLPLCNTHRCSATSHGREDFSVYPVRPHL